MKEEKKNYYNIERNYKQIVKSNYGSEELFAPIIFQLPPIKFFISFFLFNLYIFHKSEVYFLQKYQTNFRKSIAIHKEL